MYNYYHILMRMAGAMTAAMAGVIFISHGAFATDYTLSDNSSDVTLNASDTATISDKFGDDDLTDSDLITVSGDDVAISVSGIVQGNDDLILSGSDHDNFSITISEGAHIVASGQRALDIDGNNDVATNVVMTNNGTIYSAERNALTAQDTQNASFVNGATGLITSSDRTILFNDSAFTTLTNRGIISANNDNITYGTNQVVNRVETADGYALAATDATDLTIDNEGTISSNGRRTIYLHSTNRVTVNNTGTISGTDTEVFMLEQAQNVALTNDGTVSGTTNVIYGDELEDSTITNNDNASISATGDIAVYLQYADNTTFINRGSVSSTGGTVIDTRNAVSATITNSGSITSTATGTDYLLTGQNTVFTNQTAGTMTSSAHGLNLVDDNEFNNYGSLSVNDNSSAISIVGNNNVIRLYDGARIDGAVSANSGTTGNILAIENDTAMSLSDNISGPIALTKTGDATLTITGTQSYSGATTLTEGTLRMNGTATSSAITIGTSGTLGGSGTTGDVVNNGTLTPGNSIGTLNVSGDMTLSSSSNLEIEVTGDGASDKIIATGAVTAAGSLKLIPTRETTFGNVETYTIIDAGSTSGTFGSISIRACGADIDTSYSASAITVTLTGCFAAKGKSLAKLEDYINKLYDENPSADFSTVLTALEGLSGDEYEKALGTLDIDAPMAIVTHTAEGMRTVNDFIAHRATIQSGNNSARQTLRMMTAADPISADSKLSLKNRLAAHSRKGMWVKGYGGNGEKKAVRDLGLNGYDYDFAGTTIGFDLESQTIKHGIALSLQKGSVTSNNRQGYQDYETVMLNYQNTQFFNDGDSLSLSTGIAVTKVDAKRYIDVGVIDRTATSDYRSYSLDFAAGYSYAPMRLGNFSNDLTLSFGMHYNTRESYREKGADSLNMSVDPKHTAKAQFGIDNTFYWDKGDRGAGSFLPFVSGGIFASRHLTNTAVKQSLSGASKVKITTDRDQDVFGEIGFGFVNIEDDDDELRLLTKAKFSDKVTEYSASLDYGVKF